VVEPTAKVAAGSGPRRSLPRVSRGPSDVPTLFRFLVVVAVLAGIAFAAMFALATFVEPTPREISVTIPNAKLQPK
jgi:hypothetical protein